MCISAANVPETTAGSDGGDFGPDKTGPDTPRSGNSTGIEDFINFQLGLVEKLQWVAFSLEVVAINLS